MSDNKHTPGPWEASFDDSSGDFEIRMGGARWDDDGEYPSGYETQHHVEYNPALWPEDGDQFEECKANFNLMAAAPDLLEALERSARAIHALHPRGEIADCIARSCRANVAAIEKAKGEWR